ncbi:MAG: hypothetical protein ACRD4Y_06880, partial [Candidatus Acidiferrales bacterium]
FEYDNYDGNDNPFLRRVLIWDLRLWRLHLAPEQCGFSVDLDVDRQHLVRTIMDLSCDDMPRTFMATVEDDVPEISPVSQPYVVDDARPLDISIYLKPGATQAQRDYAYSFNLKCMDKIGGCRDKHDLLSGPRP